MEASEAAPADAPVNVVAIDGPAGAGKSTAARAVAEHLGIAFLDTGATYRAATWWAMHGGVDLSDPEAVAARTRTMALALEGGRVVVNGHDVTHEIRTPEVTRNIWRIDEISAVRRQLVALQRRFARAAPCVAEGRDLGTVVFPQARCKVFLDASLEARAQRRAQDLAAAGHAFDVDQVRTEIAARDARTATRADSPLRQADDAVRIDTTGLTLEQVVDAIAALARERLCLA